MFNINKYIRQQPVNNGQNINTTDYNHQQRKNVNVLTDQLVFISELL